MAEELIKIPKIAIYVGVIAVVVTFIASYFMFSYLPSQQKTSDLEEYKSALYESTLCQYSCPLTSQVFQNKTRMLPESACVESCASSFREKQKNGKSFTNQDLLGDSLVSDIENVVNTCRTDSTDFAKLETNDTKFFDCVSSGLTGLKGNYTYLN